MLGAVDSARCPVKPVIEPDTLSAGKAAMAPQPHVRPHAAFLAADGSLSPFQASSPSCIEPARLDALRNALLLIVMSLVDGSGMLFRGRRGLRKANG